jgi:hypothetical protein
VIEAVPSHRAHQSLRVPVLPRVVR